MHWLVPVSAISGGEGVDGMSGGSHSSQTPCRRECMGDKLMIAICVKGTLHDANSGCSKLPWS